MNKLMLGCTLIAALMMTQSALAQCSSCENVGVSQGSLIAQPGCDSCASAYSPVVPQATAGCGCSTAGCGCSGGAGLLGNLAAPTGGPFGSSTNLGCSCISPSSTRNFWQLLTDSNWTRTISVYGGAESFDTEADDIFGGAGDVNSKYSAGIEIGRRHSPNWRSAFDFTIRESDFTTLGLVDEELTAYSLLKNVYYDFGPPCKRVRPYLGLGLGYAKADAVDDDDDAFAFQFIAGASLKMAPQWSLFSEYRYFRTSDFDIGPLGGEYISHNGFVGLRFGY